MQEDARSEEQARPRLHTITARELWEMDTGTRWASVSYCTGGSRFLNLMGYAKPITRHIHATRDAAYAAKATIDQRACGGGCEEWHTVEEALPQEKVGHGYRIKREKYTRYGGVIPAYFLLPAEREAAIQVHANALRQRTFAALGSAIAGGYVYILLAVGTARIKIGRSEVFPKRFTSLRTASPFPLQVLREMPTEDAVALEKFLHRRHAAYRCHGEWFELPPETLERLLRIPDPYDL